MAALQYCVAPPDPRKQAIIAYGPPIDAGAAYLIFGNATLGVCLAGKPLVHCHAVIRDADGRMRGGHILTKSCVIGPVPVSVLVIRVSPFIFGNRLPNWT